VNQKGDEIGLVRNGDRLELFTAEPRKESVQATINQVKQVYARVQILNKAKQQGFQVSKEEKLADGSVRLVFQKWR
jgi:hypothetical protein